MKTKRIVPAMMCAWICLTGCGGKTDLTFQKNDVPVIPAETTFLQQTDVRAADETETAAGITETRTSAVQTGKNCTETAAITSSTVAAAPQNTGSSGSGNATAESSLYGKWETVSFAKDSGGHVSYDLSDPVHRSYYVALDLNADSQTVLTVGTVSHPATAALYGSMLNVYSANKDDPVSMEFTVSADKSRLTVELMNGRIIATLKRIQHDFSIREYLTADPPAEPSYSAADLVGEWSVPGTFGARNNSMTVRKDGSVIMRYAAGGTRRGKVRIDKETLPDGSVSCRYSLCDDDDTVWLGFACGETPVNQLRSDGDDGIEFVRISLEDIAVEKMNNLTFLMQSLSGGGGDLEIDRSRTVTAAGQTYALCTDARFAINSLKKAAFERLLEETVSGTEQQEWKNLLDTCFYEQDGLGYVLISDAHGFLTFETGSGVTITQQTETSFTAATKDRNMIDGRGTANLVFDGTNWTIESYEFR